VSGPEEVAQASSFIRVAGVSAIALGVNGATVGALLGAGETRFPFVASLVGQYLIAVPVGLAGTVTSLGIGGLYIAFVVGFGFPAVVNLWWFRRMDWKKGVGKEKNEREALESRTD